LKNIEFHIVQAGDNAIFQTIADWYLQEWKIPTENTFRKLELITSDALQFQAIVKVDSEPVATGGLYNHVGLMEKEPRFKIYNNWLALVYTRPEHRKSGYGASICKFIQEQSAKRGINEMYLFTDTAKSLYSRLGWTELEKVSMGNRNVVVMKKNLAKEH
jgi:GNAT superfamily N-acetyltransferase